MAHFPDPRLAQRDHIQHSFYSTTFRQVHATTLLPYHPLLRDHFVYAPSQWETTLQRKVIYYWLGSFTKHSLITHLWHCLATRHPWWFPWTWMALTIFVWFAIGQVIVGPILLIIPRVVIIAQIYIGRAVWQFREANRPWRESPSPLALK